MSANVGDRIRMHANSVDTPDRTGTIVGVLGTDGPPYRIRFDSGEETIVTPGPDATIEPPTWSDKIDQVGEQLSERAEQARAAAREKAGEWRTTAQTKGDELRDGFRSAGGEAKDAADQARDAAKDATGSVARKVAETAEKIAQRFER